MATTPFQTIPRVWDSLEPAMRPEEALERMKHVRLMPSTTYPLGQVLCPVIGGANAGKVAKPGTVISGSTLGRRTFTLRYPYITDANGRAYLGAVLPNPTGSQTGFDSVEAFFGGYFFVKDLTGIPDDAALGELGNLVQGGAFDDPSAIVHLK